MKEKLKQVKAPNFEKENVNNSNFKIEFAPAVRTTPATPEKRILVNLNMHTI